MLPSEIPAIQKPAKVSEFEKSLSIDDLLKAGKMMKKKQSLAELQFW